MNVSEAIHARRAYRSLMPVEITRELVEDLASHAQLSASCFNNQPWRYVFVYDREKLEEMYEALSRGNAWARQASMIIAAFSKPEDDCQIRERIYHQFDLGMATATLILRATELGLVAHPIAGFSPKKTREILGIPEEYTVLTLIIVGKKMQEIHPSLSEDQAKNELKRPERKPLPEWAFHNKYQET
ncbi:MAG: nitroreductase family protein [Candidatus Bathyarchaeota archaeon]|nr:nitroreductase family protein [Candidatus Bathyarchaeota archaeon]